MTRLTKAWTFNYGAGSLPAGGLSLDFRFQVQPLLIGGVMYISTPASPRDPDFKSTVTALEPETGKVALAVHLAAAHPWPGPGVLAG